MSSPDDSVSALLGVSGAFIGLSTVAVALRFYTRRRLGVPYAADDWCMLATLPMVIAYCACVIALVRIGWLGWGAQPFPQSELIPKFQTAAKIVIASDVAMFICFVLTKASALLLYRRIFCKTGSSLKKGLEYTIYGTLAVIVLWAIAFTFLAGFQCGTHLLDSYKTQVNLRYCRVGTSFDYGAWISDLILDLWVIVLPIPSILSLHAPPARKMMTVGLFLVVLVGVIASVLRFVKFYQVLILHQHKYPAKEVEDISSIIFFYNVLEIGMFAVSINMVVLWGLFTKVVPEHVVKMARSISSLVSTSSSQNSSRHDTNNTTTTARNYSNSFRMGSVDRSRTRPMTETYATHDADGPIVPDDQKEHILVNETFRVDSTTSSAEDEIRSKYAEGEV